MVRKLFKALLAGSLLLPSLVFALGLGDIHLRSGLNQQLDAEIDLLSVEPSEADQLTVSLASYETFAKLGVDRPAVLMLMNFEVLKRSNGTPYIAVRSKELINEPFLDFLVEVTWPSGKVLREYTLLLDPPTMSARQEPIMVQAPQIEEAPAAPAPALPVQEPVVSAPVDMAATPVAEEPQPLVAPAEQPAQPEQAAAQEPQLVEEQPAEAPAPTVAAAPERTTGRFPVDEQQALVEPSPASSEAMSYGPVKKNEILYRIANSMRPDDVSVEQMMIALYNSNREAFIHNNINLLRKGAVLRIEDPAALRALSQAEARRQVARHGRAWEEYRSKIAARTPKSVPTEPVAEPAPGGAVATTQDETKLTLVAPSKPSEGKQGKVGGTAEKGGEAEALRKELLLANEAAEARRKENEELNTRLKELEGQLQQMQKLLSLKDDNLAAMQQKLAEQQKAAAAGTAAETAQPAQPAQPTPMVEPAKTPEPAQVEPAPAPAPAKVEPPPATPEAATTPAAPAETVKPAAPADATAPAAEGAPATAAQAPAEQPKPAAAPKRPKKAVVLPPPPPEPSFVDQLLEDPMMLGAAGLLLLLLVLGLAVVLRRRRQGRGFQESILTVGTTSSMMKGKGENPASETSFLSDLAISGMGGRVQPEEADVDPLTEADVYMAYNRFPQAEELLKEGLKHNPERDDLHAKLLEVYYKSKNRAAFEQLAEARYASMQKNEGMWQKVVAMGHELAPDNPLFKGAAVAAGAAAFASAASAEPSGSASEVFDIGLDLDALSSEMEAAGAPSSDFVDLGLDFSDLGMEEDKKKPEEPVAEATDLDFNFDLGGAGEAPAEEAEAPSLDFDLSAFGGADETAVPEVSEPLPAEETTLGGLDFDLGSLAEETPAAEEEASTSLDFGDFDLGGVSAEPEAEPESSFDLGSMDFGGGEITSSESDTLDFGDLDLGSTGEESLELGDLGGGAEPSAMDLSDLGDFGDFGDLGGDTDFGGMDEVGTKLDLAKAYVDMGDAEGARSMLEEVMQEGNDEQKVQAKELLSQIA